MLHSFLSDNTKQYAATTAAHIKRISYLLKRNKCLGFGHSNILENIDGCDEHYRCDISLYLFLILSQLFDIIIDHDISIPGNGIEVVDDLNDT